MIDFKNASFMKLKPVPDSDFAGMLQPMLLQDSSFLC